MFTIEWSLFFALLVGGVLSAAAVLPYALAMNGQSITPEVQQKIKLPKSVLMLLSTIQSGVLLAIASFVGLLAAQQVGLHFPILQAALAGQPVGEKILAILPVVLIAGAVSGLALVLFELFVFAPRIPENLRTFDGRISFWKRVLACFYGMFGEEIFMRLFLMGGLVWLLGLVWKAPDGLPAAGAFWLSIVLAAILFGLGHLPATRGITPLTPLIVVRAVVLNGIPGIALGYLYWQYGLGAAMLAHFSLDILIHLIAPIWSKG